MWTSLKLPRLNDYMVVAKITALHARVGERLSPGSRLFDVSVDLSAAVAHDCPPVSYFRICLSESAWLRQWSVATGDEVAAGSVLALFSSSPDEPSPPVVTNTARLSVAGIVCEIGWWEGGGT